MLLFFIKDTHGMEMDLETSYATSIITKLLLKLKFPLNISAFSCDVRIKGNITHVQVFQVFMKFLLQMDSDIRRMLGKF